MDLDLRIESSPLEPFIAQLYNELRMKGLVFRPACYLADEWLCPDKEPIIGIPFWLAHPRLKSIEIEMMYEAEGGSPQSCMKLLRHECGHAINYAYKIYKRTRWRDLFGPFSEKYSDVYRYQPYSRRFVVHLDDHYAQAHPDEDFAETFAVWLTPNSHWQEKYHKWPAVQKLNYINNLMERIGHQMPLLEPPKSPPWAAARMRSTLQAYYQRKRQTLGREFKGYYDDSLKSVFSIDNRKEDSIRADKMIKRYQRLIINHLALWTGHRKYDIHQLISRVVERCRVLDLYTSEDPQGLIGIVSLLTAIAGGTHRPDTRGKK